jgi:lipoprotein-releasing system permease protein
MPDQDYSNHRQTVPIFHYVLLPVLFLTVIGSIVNLVESWGDHLRIYSASLIVVLSVMNGFERELKTRILSVTSHATLTGLEGNLKDWRHDQAQALKLPGVVAAVPYIEAQALLMHGARTVVVEC